jgi:hypothetical protein
MTIQERILDLQSSGIFNDEELENTNDQNTFKSWEYWQILHYTNEEWYYVNDDGIEELADERVETDKGIFFCFS